MKLKEFVFKVKIFWEGHNLVMWKQVGDFFQFFVAFTENLLTLKRTENFILLWMMTRGQEEVGGQKTPKGGFFSESEIRFSNLPTSQKKFSKKLSWAWNLNK